jgi:sulfur-oxidizing protein SoxZ
MSTPTRIRAIAKDGAYDVRLLITHPMDSGLRKDAAGQPIPPRYITHFSAALNGRVVISARWSYAVSQDPFLWFRVRQAKPGDTLTVTWKDNTGDGRTDSLVLA